MSKGEIERWLRAQGYWLSHHGGRHEHWTNGVHRVILHSGTKVKTFTGHKIKQQVARALERRSELAV